MIQASIYYSKNSFFIMMYILTIEQEKRDIQWLCFNSLDSGRKFLSLLPGYRNEINDNFRQEWIRTDLFPDYSEILFRGNRIPISKFMFANRGEMEVYFTEIPCPDIENQGLINGITTIDAYSIPNEAVKHYIETREQAFETIRQILKEKNIETNRSFHGSEDGEAILYRRQGETEWHFLDHMDPIFVEMGEKGEAEIKEWLESLKFKV